MRVGKGGAVLIGDLLGGLVGAVFGEAIGGKFVDKKRNRLQQESVVVCTLRVVEGEYSVIGRRWRGGQARLSPGMIDFKRQFRSQRFSIPVVGIDSSDPRTPSATEVWWVDPDAKIVRVATPAAVLEWAVGSAHFDWAVETVGAGL